MPDSGDVHGVEASQRSDSQVRVFPMPPRDNAGPEEIMQGFLEVLTSDDPQFEMARRYLTTDAAHTWHPELSTTVLTDGPNLQRTTDRSGYDDAEGRQYTLNGRKIATVDEQHAYAPAQGGYRETVHLTLQTRNGHREWRIDRPPSSAVLGTSDFQRMYRPVDKYYFARDDSTGPGAQAPLVADPVYVRQRLDPVTQTVRSLLAGPSRWIDPAVRSAFPAGTALRPGTRAIAPDDENRLRVPLNTKADHITQPQCLRMAAQIVFTLRDLTATGIAEVQLRRSDGSSLCELGKDRAETVAPHHSADRPGHQYFLDDKNRTVRLPATGSDDQAEPVPGPLGTGDKPLSAIAVARDEQRAAGISLDRRTLYITDLATSATLGEPALHSKAKAEKDGLTAPSWDARGDLWVADRNPRKPALLLLDPDTDQPLRVDTPGLDPARIEAVRIASDGVRIALLTEDHGSTSLSIGRVHRTRDADGGPVVTVTQLRPGAPQMEDVTAMSWAGGSRLVVVGRESGGVQQIRFVQCDGSAPASGVLPGLTGVQQIAASDDDRLPLVAHSDDGIVRLPPGTPWQTVRKKGTAPVYPG
ncbi:LpqB family beta-propeller domain-containing protein [Streptomyces sp. NPDC058045]|uniref:LpqB family beta-propeller domain-containing protein n=1 Tax=Streptomyces sp. NPDC058045 TaxID=3346311 RepID=UPI0036E6F7AD